MGPEQHQKPRRTKARRREDTANNPALAQAMHAHRAGNLAEADRLYQTLLRQDPKHAEALNLRGVLAVQAGRPDIGIDHIGRAVAIDRRNPVFHYNLALANQAAGRREAAIASYRTAVGLKPDYGDALSNLGNLLLSRGETDEAVTCYRKALRLAPANPMAHNNLGTGLLAGNAWDEAEGCFQAALRLRPDYADAHNGLGAVLLAQERYREAEDALAEALRIDPRHVRAHNNLGLTRAATGRFEEAASSFRTAVQVDPRYVEAHRNLGTMFFEMARFDEAEACFRDALRISPDHLRARLDLAKVFEEREDSDGALEIYNEILEKSPNCELALVGKARALEDRGQIAAAYTIIRRLSDRGVLSPEAADVFGELANTVHNMSEDGISLRHAVVVMEQVLERPFLTSEARRMLHFTLGRLYDELGDFEQAFQHFGQGNVLRPTPFSPDSVAAATTQRIGFFTSERLARLPRATNRSEMPVFIVGMPRSGTTLVEQILDRHPDVVGAGELKDLEGISRRLTNSPDSHPATFRDLTGVDAAALEAAATRHLEKLQGLAGSALRVTDKMPYNFRYLGLIQLLFPGARIIHCVRDPLDTCLSCYFQNFRAGNFHAFDLGHVGAYYVQYRRLMDHWRRVLDLPMLEVRYEEHVGEPERVCREMLAFLGLAWDPRCLRFHESTRAVKTASREQVRKPIYTRSAGRWRNYERHLGPLKEALREVL